MCLRKSRKSSLLSPPLALNILTASQLFSVKLRICLSFTPLSSSLSRRPRKERDAFSGWQRKGREASFLLRLPYIFSQPLNYSLKNLVICLLLTLLFLFLSGGQKKETKTFLGRHLIGRKASFFSPFPCPLYQSHTHTLSCAAYTSLSPL